MIGDSIENIFDRITIVDWYIPSLLRMSGPHFAFKVQRRCFDPKTTGNSKGEMTVNVNKECKCGQLPRPICHGCNIFDLFPIPDKRCLKTRLGNPVLYGKIGHFSRCETEILFLNPGEPNEGKGTYIYNTVDKSFKKTHGRFKETETNRMFESVIEFSINVNKGILHIRTGKEMFSGLDARKISNESFDLYIYFYDVGGVLKYRFRWKKSKKRPPATSVVQKPFKIPEKKEYTHTERWKRIVLGQPPVEKRKRVELEEPPSKTKKVDDVDTFILSLSVEDEMARAQINLRIKELTRDIQRLQSHRDTLDLVD